MTAVYTAGHGSRPLADFLRLLKEAGVEAAVDVRRFPVSRRHPQFNREPLARALEAAGIRYVWCERLGGRRREVLPAERSPNRAWTVPGFRHYADHLLTPEAQHTLARLVVLARETPLAVFCAERFPWRCHRRILADHLHARGLQVLHLLEPGTPPRPHRPPVFARLADEEVTYPESPLLEA